MALTIVADEFTELYVEIRDYVEERLENILESQRIIGQYGLKDQYGNIDEDALIELFQQEHSDIKILKYESAASFTHDLQEMIESYRLANIKRDEDFEFFRAFGPNDTDPDRIFPASGIHLINLRYHSTNPVKETDELSSRGFKAPKVIRKIISEQYPCYLHVLDDYYRPLGTTTETFKDFNKEQIECQPPAPERNEETLDIVKILMNARPYRPLKYTSAHFAKLPLSTGTAYYDRCHYRTRALARLTTSAAYAHKPTSKGYFINAVYTTHRTQIHNMKSFQCPQPVEEEDDYQRRLQWELYIAKRATILHTRNHISDKDPKTRPVYNVDPVFLRIETMLTFPLMIQMRPISSCLMYSLETIRGGCHYLDNLAKGFTSYFTIDWSSFDQRVPRVLTDIYYTDFLESLIIIGKGYTPTLDYLEKKTPRTAELFFPKMANLLHSLHEWYNSMVYVTADGYAYQRLHAGIPSGLLNTQLLDSFINIYIIVDAMLEYGYTKQQILSYRFFIMGDDNTAFTHQPVSKLEAFISFLEEYAKRRWNMTMSKTKSIVTQLRQNIEVLGYTVNFGFPKRNLNKLVAQLCYPEHGLKTKYMSFRALGIAYAAAGQCETFHNFCRDVYMAFLEYKPDLTFEIRQKLVKHIPGIFKSLDDLFTEIDYTRFPSIHEVREVYKEWKGSLTYAPRWDPAFFTTPPYYEGDDYETLLSYRKKNNIPRKKVNFYLIDDHILQNTKSVKQ